MSRHANIRPLSLDVLPEAPPVSPPGMRVPHGGSSCASCIYVHPVLPTCVNPRYVELEYKGKRKGDPRFIDGKTGRAVGDPNEFCCNVYDWER